MMPHYSLGQPIPNKAEKKVSPAKTSGKVPETPKPPTPTAPIVPPPFYPIFFAQDSSHLKYLGNEPKLVYEWVQAKIDSVPGKPDQFSSTEDKQKYQTNVTEQMNAIGLIPILGKCQMKYDGDRQAFEVKDTLFSLKGSLERSLDPESLNLRNLILANHNIKQDSYTASNAYGATMEVSRRVSDQYSMVFPFSTNTLSDITTLGSSASVNIYRYSFYFLALEAKMPPDVARQNEKNIACI